ncbi:hypothetical protein [Rhizobium sp. GN54]|nr:hypothetical protein [Rhizobium sp. GN54]
MTGAVKAPRIRDLRPLPGSIRELPDQIESGQIEAGQIESETR